MSKNLAANLYCQPRGQRHEDGPLRGFRLLRVRRGTHSRPGPGGRPAATALTASSRPRGTASLAASRGVKAIPHRGISVLPGEAEEHRHGVENTAAAGRGGNPQPRGRRLWGPSPGSRLPHRCGSNRRGSTRQPQPSGPAPQTRVCRRDHHAAHSRGDVCPALRSPPWILPHGQAVFSKKV